MAEATAARRRTQRRRPGKAPGAYPSSRALARFEPAVETSASRRDRGRRFRRGGHHPYRVEDDPAARNGYASVCAFRPRGGAYGRGGRDQNHRAHARLSRPHEHRSQEQRRRSHTRLLPDGSYSPVYRPLGSSQRPVIRQTAALRKGYDPCLHAFTMSGTPRPSPWRTLATRSPRTPMERPVVRRDSTGPHRPRVRRERATERA